MNELMPSLQSQIDNGFSDFAIVANLLLQYYRADTINNLNSYTGPYLDYLEDCGTNPKFRIAATFPHLVNQHE